MLSAVLLASNNFKVFSTIQLNVYIQKALFLQSQSLNSRSTITRIPSTLLLNGHFIVAVWISPVFLYFVWGVDVGAYQMLNSTPAVPKHPQWVQISAPLLLVLLLNILLQQRDVFFFFHEFV